jgi:hypothetical protein
MKWPRSWPALRMASSRVVRSQHPAARVLRRLEVVVVNTGPDATEWYVRSMGDNDTHRGRYCTTTSSVHALCGMEFMPLPIGWRGQRLALSGQPPDPEQICSDCSSAKVRNFGGLPK